MILVFVRHGEAEEAGGADRDEARQLTRRGRKQTELVAKALDLLHFRPDILLTSPLVRAVQTTETAASCFRKAPKPVVAASLAPGQEWREVQRDIARALRGLKVADPVVLLCGHQPDLGKYLTQTLAGQPGEGLAVEKSAAICVAWREAGFEKAGRICLALGPQSAKRIVKIASS